MEMMIIVRTKTDALFNAIAAQLNSLVALDGENGNIDIEITPFIPKKERVSRKGIPLGARKFYVAVGLPEDPAKRAEAIKANLEAIGEGKLVARIYQHITESQQPTEQSIRATLKIPSAGTSQRLIGDLTRMQLVESRDIVVEGQ